MVEVFESKMKENYVNNAEEIFEKIEGSFWSKLEKIIERNLKEFLKEIEI